MTTFTLKIEGLPPLRGLTREEVDALVRTARNFNFYKPNQRVDSGPRIDVQTEETK